MTLEDYKEGQIILIDKPLNWTSFQVVNKIRWLIRKQFGVKNIKVGHAGTLDPLATGLLILCTGKFTKKIESIQSQEKEYTGTITLGATTPSFDLETEIDQTFDISNISEEQLINASYSFIGEIEQQPPVFSAIKKDGKRLYEFARSGMEVDVPKRNVRISSFDFTKIDLPNVHFKVSCSKGTYIRSLAHDFGRSMNNGAYLSNLRRTRIGEFSIESAMSIESFEEQLTKQALSDDGKDIS